MTETNNTDIDDENITTSEEEIRINLRKQIKDLRQQLKDHST